MKLDIPLFITISLESWLGIYQPTPTNIKFTTKQNGNNLTIFFPTYSDKRKMLHHLSEKSPKNISEVESNKLMEAYEQISKSRLIES